MDHQADSERLPGDRFDQGSWHLRVELQLRKSLIVERVLGVTTVGELIDGRCNIEATYRNFIENRLMLKQLQARCLSHTGQNGIHDMLKHAQNHGSERWRTEFLQQIGLVTLCSELGPKQTAQILAPIRKNATSTERVRHSRMLKKTRAAVLDSFDPKDMVYDYSRNMIEVLTNLQDIISG